MSGFLKLPMLLDGATGTNLMAAGMPQSACAEQWILDNPNVIMDLQRRYSEAGSDVVMAPTFESNRHKLNFHGLGDKVADINKRLVELSRKAVDGKSLVAGDISPTGLFIEPFGESTFEELVAIYREQAFALKDAGIDYIALETMISLTEARAALLAAKETGLPVTVSLTVDKNCKLLTGGEVLPCLVTLAAMGAEAVGLNCSTGPDVVYESLKTVAQYLPVPLIAKPNAGLPRNIEGTHIVYDISPEEFAEYVPKFLNNGIGILGGCCGSTPEHIALMRQQIDKTSFGAQVNVDTAKADGIRDFIAADEKHVFFIDEENLDFSHKIDCGPNLADDLVSIDDDGFVAARIMVKTIDDAREFGLNAYLITMPVVLLSYDYAAMDQALMLYQGRAMIDKKSEIAPEKLEELSKRYGAIII
jgi:5-methyltetrahydrofolate--homocysteine methyltransferase